MRVKLGWWLEWMNMERRQAKGQNQLTGSSREGDSIFLLKNSLSRLSQGSRS